jgi:hypothetical protein
MEFHLGKELGATEEPAAQRLTLIHPQQGSLRWVN